MFAAAATVIVVFVSALLAQTSAGLDLSGIAGFLAAIAALCGGGGVFAFFKLRSGITEAKAVAEGARADAANSLTQANASFAQMLKDNADEWAREGRELRAEVRASRAEAAEERAQRALAEAALERERAERSEERHALLNDLAAERAGREAARLQHDKLVAELRHEIEDLRNTVRELTGRLHEQGVLPDRRAARSEERVRPIAGELVDIHGQVTTTPVAPVRSPQG